MKDMIDFYVLDDEKYGVLPKQIPSLNQIIDIVHNIKDDYSYSDYINEIATEKLDKIFWESRQELLEDRKKISPEEFAKKYEEIIEDYDPESDDLTFNNRNIQSIAEYEHDQDEYSFNEENCVPMEEGSFDEIITSTPIDKLAKIHNSIKNKITKIHNGKDIRRAIITDTPKSFIDDLKSNKIPSGIYWSYEHPAPYGDCRMYGGNMQYSVELDAIFKPEAIEKVKTIIANLSRPQEDEIRVREGSTGRMKEICICYQKEEKDCECEKVDFDFIA